ncbi:hypothetical protein T440DRAFT_474449 [Plenodomus tracheiphilus IPT5]|uniref:Uncharacterized protein n=1 Tax=Plenodomus tracheiphilus IPT5 TaxID=1408161 RepID=A0A6A7BPB5_9PLEO|nr:hypothetical protein T440DRAFT_474449 [Plenodomus tracheiphilus IPT5]
MCENRLMYVGSVPTAPSSLSGSASLNAPSSKAPVAFRSQHCVLPVTSISTLEIESPEAKKIRLAAEPLHPTHPQHLLEHLIRSVLPPNCTKQMVKDSYKEQLDDPDTATAVCKSLLEDWVLEYWNAAKLDKLAQLKKKLAITYSMHGIIYTIFLVVDEWLWHYVDNADLKFGPTLNIMEQGLALNLHGLRPSELKDDFSPDTAKCINVTDLDHGVEIRGPLAQGFGFGDFPSRGELFKWSQDMLKREIFDVKRQHKVIDKKETLLEVGQADIDRFEEETIRAHCDLKPPGQQQPHTVIRGLYSPPKYDDPAVRLSIKIGSIRKGDQKEGNLWVRKEGDSDSWVSDINRLVDWLEAKDLNDIRPRRCYPTMLGKWEALITRHPIDVGNAWTERLSFENFDASNLRYA